MNRSNLMRTLSQNVLILPVYLPSLVFAFSQGLLVPILPI